VLPRAYLAAEKQILERLAAGTLLAGYPKVALKDVVTIGMGKSLGGALALVQAGRYACYDGLAALGSSAVWTHPPTRPGEAGIVAPWVAREMGAGGWGAGGAE
jgi:hypothetical protein